MAKGVTILSIETATQVCSVAVHRDGHLLGISELNLGNAHGSKLLRLIESLLLHLDLDTDSLDAVAVSCGPGSFTGLRIGVSTAKGLCFARQIPLIAVDTLEGLAAPIVDIVECNSHIIPMLDAKRHEVYAAIFQGNGIVLKPSHPLVVENNPFLELLETGKVYFLGDGVNKLKVVLGHPNAVFLADLNSAIGVGKLAYRKFVNGKFEDLAYFEPNYLKEFRVIASKKNPLEV